MEFIQVVGIVVAVFAISRGYFKFRKKSIRKSVFIVWNLIWLAVIVVAVLPQTTSFVANMLGIGRGIDVVVYLSIILLYYLGFKLYLKMEDTRKEITNLVRELSFKGKKK